MEDLLICCDWGTSNFRMYLIESEGFKVVTTLESGKGISEIYGEWALQTEQDRESFYATYLGSQVRKLEDHSGRDLNGIPVLISGMGSSSIGFHELPYSGLPFPVDGSRAKTKFFRSDREINSPVFLISGVQSDKDVMRGEETQIVGLVEMLEGGNYKNKEEQVYILPGTHSKHIIVTEGRITDFKTYMTGEIFDVISHHSILKNSVLKDSGSENNPSHRRYLRQGVALSVRSEGSLLHNLFSIRTNQLFRKMTEEENYYFLSGVLIGEEIRALRNQEKSQIIVCGGGTLSVLYRAAFEEMAAGVDVIFPEEEIIERATILGQIKIYQNRANNRHE